MNMLGFRLLTGKGCERDDDAAFEWGLKAAQAGHAEAMYGIAALYESGQGVERSEERAVHWYRQATAHGDTMAPARLKALLRRRPNLR